jgi:hypothetical protein
MDNDEIASRLFDADVMVSSVIWMAGCAACANDAMEEFLQDAATEKVKEMLGVEITEDPSRDEIEQVVADSLRKRKGGFIVELRTPIPEFFSKDDSAYRSSWGYCRTKTFYVDSLSQIIPIAEKWREEVMSDAKTKQAA